MVLLSGGLDSTVALAQLLANKITVQLALTVDYGQQAAQKEIIAATGIAAHYQVPHQVVHLSWYKTLLPGGLSPAASTLPHTFEAVWVPNRNGVLLNIAAAYAEALQADTVVFGANAEEGESFPDNTPAYRQALSAALAYSTQNRVQVAAPLETLYKQEIVALGKALDVPFGLIWSCYTGNPTPCGVCLSCQLWAQ